MNHLRVYLGLRALLAKAVDMALAYSSCKFEPHRLRCQSPLSLDFTGDEGQERRNRIRKIGEDPKRPVLKRRQVKGLRQAMPWISTSRRLRVTSVMSCTFAVAESKLSTGWLG